MLNDDFNKLHIAEWKPEETNVSCSGCGNLHMKEIGITNGGYPKYKCTNCGRSTDKDPKNAALRAKIDYRFAINKQIAGE